MKEIPLDPDSTDGRVVCIGATLSLKQESALVNFLYVENDIFAWKPSNMFDIPREVTQHSLWIKPGSKPIKQRLRHFDEEKCKVIGEEAGKLLSPGFHQRSISP